MKTLKFFCFITILATTQSLHAQKSQINFDFIGGPTFLSINYEREFQMDSGFFFTGQLGIGLAKEIYQPCLFGQCSSAAIFSSIPYRFTGNVGGKKHFFEFGLQGELINGNVFVMYPVIGYRVYPKFSPELFRIYLRIPFGTIGREEYFVPIEGHEILFNPIGLTVGWTL